jgi:hypothetical protein
MELSGINSRPAGKCGANSAPWMRSGDFSMFDRHWVTDVALAALIAFPAVLPASHEMRSAVIQSAPPAPAAELAYSTPHELRWVVSGRS